MYRIIGLFMRLIGRGFARFERTNIGLHTLWSLKDEYWKTRLGYLGNETTLYSRVVIHVPERVRIGNRVSVGDFVHIWGAGGVEIGDDVMIGAHVAITSQSHDSNAAVFRETHVAQPVVIENNCWIGTHAIILPGVTIGQGSVIGANSVVTRSVPPHSLLVGSPARIQRTLEPKRIA